MNEEQRRKAEEIVKNSKLKEIEKKYALYTHLGNVETSGIYQLPYKVVKDYNATCIEKGHAFITDVYPLPGYPSDERPIFNYPGDFNVDIPVYGGGDSIYLKEEHQRTLTAFTEQYEKDFNDAKTWDYYFLHLLQGYDFDSFTIFDFYGENREEMTQADLQLTKNYYKRKQKQYTENPGDYLNVEPTYTDKERNKYTMSSYLVNYDEETLKKHYDSLSDSIKKYVAYEDVTSVLANGGSSEELPK